MPLIEKMDCELWHFICGKKKSSIFMHENKTRIENRPSSCPLVTLLKAIRSKRDVGLVPPKMFDTPAAPMAL